jgi:hypothetical protein
MKTTKWICTDIDNNQYYRQISKYAFEFKEDRLIHPMTLETTIYQSVIDLNDYTIEEMIDECSLFGYDSDEVKEWYNNQKDSNELSLIAECIFEMEY